MQIASDTKAFAPTTERDGGANQTTKGREYRSLPISELLVSPIGIKEPGMIGVMEPVLGS